MKKDIKKEVIKMNNDVVEMKGCNKQKIVLGPQVSLWSNFQATKV